MPSIDDDVDDLYTEEAAIAAHVDTGPGSAAYSATEDWVRENSRDGQHDGRSPTDTYFDARDAPGKYPPWQKDRPTHKKRSWATMASWQDGANSDISRGSQNWWADKQRWVETFGDQIGATKYHKERAKDVLEKIDLEPYRTGQIPVETVIVAAISLLVDADVTEFDNRALARSGTRELLDDLELDVNQYEHVRSMLRERNMELLFPQK